MTDHGGVPGGEAAGAQDGDLLLSYDIATDPDPFQTSTPRTSAGARLDVGVSDGGADVYCDRIRLAVRIGSDRQAWSVEAPEASVNTAKWTVSSAAVVKGTDLGLPDEAPYASFVFEARDPADYRVDYPLVLSLDAATNQRTGHFPLFLEETSGTDDDPSTFTTKQETWQIKKSPPVFYLKNFVAAAPAAPTIPATEFGKGVPIRLAWESNGNWFEIYRKAEPAPIWSGEETTWTIPAGPATDTTLVLVASYIGDESGDGAGFEPVYLYDTLTLTVSDPDLTPSSVDVAGDASVGGGLSVAGSASVAGALGTGPLAVEGSASISLASRGGGVLSVTNDTGDGKIYLEGISGDGGGSAKGIYLSGREVGPVDEIGLFAGNTAVHGDLSASGAANLTNVAVAGTFAALGAAQPLTNNSTYQAPTDGFVLGLASAAGTPPGKRLVAWIYAQSEGLKVAATCGNFVQVGSYNANVSNTLLLPVRKGATFSVSSQTGKEPQTSATVVFKWYPLGVGKLTAPERVSVAEPPADIDAAERPTDDVDTPSGISWTCSSARSAPARSRRRRPTRCTRPSGSW